MIYTERKNRIAELLRHAQDLLMGNKFLSEIDYEVIARMITLEVGVPVVVFPAPDGTPHGWKLAAYEVPQV